MVTLVDFTGEKLKAYNFVISGWVKSLQVLKRNSAYYASDVFTVIRAEVRPSQRVNKGVILTVPGSVRFGSEP